MHIFHKWKPYKVTHLQRNFYEFPEKSFSFSKLWLKCTICKTVKEDYKEYDSEWILSDFE